MRIGTGYDIHRLTKGRAMVLGGVEIPYSKGPLGHSDGDVLLHAVSDAVLGALSRGDIGMMFPDTDPAYKDISSLELLKKVCFVMEEDGYTLGNMDCNVILEEPKLGPYKDKMRQAIAKIFNVPLEKVSVKAKTAEGLGDIGKKEAVAAYVSVLLEEKGAVK